MEKENQQLPQEVLERYTGLHDAIEADDEEAVSVWIQHRPNDINKFSGEYGVLDQAITFGSVSMLKLLIRLGADVNACDSKFKMTALHNAANVQHLNFGNKYFKDRLEKIKVLMDAGADLNVKDQEGWTPLHYAMSENNWDMITFLLNHPQYRLETEKKETEVHSELDVIGFAIKNVSTSFALQLQELLTVLEERKALEKTIDMAKESLETDQNTIQQERSLPLNQSATKNRL